MPDKNSKPNLGFVYRQFNYPVEVNRDGIAYKNGYVYFATAGPSGNFLRTRVPSRCTQEEFDLLKEKIIMTKEARAILCYLAVAYRLRQPIMFIGPTAIGKTFLIKMFSKLVEGPDFDIFDFYCNAQTDVSELMGKYIPNPNKGVVGADGKVDTKDFIYQWGVVPKAMTYTRDETGKEIFSADAGVGTMLHIEELGLAQPEIINSLMKMRGESGQIADHIQLWDDGGCRVYTGLNFWVGFSTNPPEGGYQGRNDIDPALIRSMLVIKLQDIGTDSLLLASQRIFSQSFNAQRKRKAEKKCGGLRAGKPFPLGASEDDFGMVYDIWKNDDLLFGISQIVARFHESLKALVEKGSSGSSQKIPLTFDDMSRISAFCACHQVVDPATGRLDVCATLDNAIDLYYLARLQSCDGNSEDQAICRNAEKLKKDCVYGASDTGKHIATKDGRKLSPPDYFLEVLSVVEKNTDFHEEIENKERTATGQSIAETLTILAENSANKNDFEQAVAERVAALSESKSAEQLKIYVPAIAKQVASKYFNPDGSKKQDLH